MTGKLERGQASTHKAAVTAVVDIVHIVDKCLLVLPRYATKHKNR